MAFHISCYVDQTGKKATAFLAKYVSKCEICGKHIYIDDPITWTRRARQNGGANGSGNGGALQAPEFDSGSSGVATAGVPNVATWTPTEPRFQPVTLGPDSTVDVDMVTRIARRLDEALSGEVTAQADARFDKWSRALRVELADAIAAELAAVKRVEISVNKAPAVKVGQQHRLFETLVKCCAARVNVWLAGPSGSGKTTAAMNAAKALGLPFRFTGAVGDAYALTGYNDAQGRYVRTPFREAWEHGGVFLWDEVDASDPTALLAFNAALANGEAAFPDGIIAKHADCVLIAAANTYGHGATQEYVGRLKLDAAFLKRFAFLAWDYDAGLELATAPNPEWTKRVQTVRARVAEKKIRVLVTPRESYIGAQLLAAGVPQETVENMTIRSGMTQEQWDSVK